MSVADGRWVGDRLSVEQWAGRAAGVLAALLWYGRAGEEGRQAIVSALSPLPPNVKPSPLRARGRQLLQQYRFAGMLLLDDNGSLGPGIKTLHSLYMAHQLELEAAGQCFLDAESQTNDWFLTLQRRVS